MGQFLPRPGDKFRHFKNGLYQVVTTAEHSETGEKMIVYQALYGDFKVYVRSYNMFISRVDQQKYPDVKQEFRFTYIEDPAAEMVSEDIDTAATGPTWQSKAAEPVSVAEYQDSSSEKPDYEELKAADELLEDMLLEDIKVEAEKAVTGLIDFLDADTYTQKLEVLDEMKNRLNDDILQAMADSLEIVLNASDIDEKYQELRHCLRTFEKYEKAR